MSAAKPAAFATPAAFRAWLERHHRSAAELLVRCRKRQARSGGLTYAEALDQALCFGWIDGVRRAIDADAFSVRFSPRKPNSVWSRVNIERATALESAGRMRAAGIAAFRARAERGAVRYSYESKALAFDAALTQTFRANAAAWRDFSTRPPGYRRLCTFWVMSAKQPATRVRRLGVLIEHSERGESMLERWRRGAKRE